MNIRNSARAVILNENNQILLMKFVQNKIKGDVAWWVFPGGGVKEESYEEACIREIFEETGNVIDDLKLVWIRDIILPGKEEEFTSHEQFYLVRVTEFSIRTENFTDNEKKTFKEYKWFSLEELRDFTGNLSVENAFELLRDIIHENVREYPVIF